MRDSEFDYSWEAGFAEIGRGMRDIDMKRKRDVGFLPKRNGNAGSRHPSLPLSPHPTPFLQILRLVTVLFYRINDTKLDVGIEIQELTQTNSDTQYKEKANCDI